MKTVVITGASTGIGRAAARHMAEQGWQVFAGVRKAEDAEALQGDHANIAALMLDVTDPASISEAVATVSDALEGQKLAGLVNNAGIAQMGPLAVQPMDEIRAHFDVNLFGAMAATQAFVPLLGMETTRSGAPGRIVNITSVGGVISAPFLGAYAATKHALEALTDSLRRELMVYGIDAIAVGPGAVATPIWDKADSEDELPYQNTAWAGPIQKFAEVMLGGGRNGLPPEEIAKVIETALSDPSPKARYAPVPNKLTNFSIPSRLPKRWLDKIFAGRFGLKAPD
ncbi:MAG: SDR family oxidoreductase [Hyphomonadaceae bacterium]|nr:SDR family oxidoreductase [Hyphomonadaceae bacterium]